MPFHLSKSSSGRTPHIQETPVSRAGARHSTRTKRVVSPTGPNSGVRRVEVSGVGTATQVIFLMCTYLCNLLLSKVFWIVEEVKIIKPHKILRK